MANGQAHGRYPSRREPWPRDRERRLLARRVGRAHPAHTQCAPAREPHRLPSVQRHIRSRRTRSTPPTPRSWRGKPAWMRSRPAWAPVARKPSSGESKAELLVNHPTPEDLSAAFRSGPDGARLASQFLDAVLAGLPSSTNDLFRQTPKNAGGRPVVRMPARVVPSTAAERYGWRWWALRPDGVLVSPIRGAEVARRGSTFDADCARGSPASPDCSCGVHYVLRAIDLAIYVQHCLTNWAAAYPTLQRLRDGSWVSVLTYGVAVGAVEVDRTEHADMPARRAQLARRYGCEVIPETSVEACRAVSDRLVSSVLPARMAELAT